MLHGEGRRQDSLAPAELLTQQDRAGAVGVEHEDADQGLWFEAGGDDPPAVEERAAGTSTIVDDGLLASREIASGGWIHCVRLAGRDVAVGCES